MKKGRLAWVGWLLVVLAVLLSTASYAWLSINTSARTRGFEVSAYSDSQFLEISTERLKNYDTKIKFDKALYINDDESGELFLVTFDYLPEEGAFTLTSTPITEENASEYGQDGKYNGSGVFYKAVESDITSATDTYVNALNEIKIGDSLVGYYHLEVGSPTPIATMADTNYYIKHRRPDATIDYVCIGPFDLNEQIAGRMYWGHAISEKEGDPQPEARLNVIALDDPGKNYVLKQTVYLRCGKNTLDAKNLRISEIKMKGLTDYLTGAIRILAMVSSDMGQEKTVVFNPKDEPFPSEVLLDTLCGDQKEIVKVDLFVYFDGRDDDAFYPNGILSTQTIDVIFTIDEHEYN